MLVQIAKTGMNVYEFYVKWLIDKTLAKSSLSSEVKLVAKTADALLESNNDNVINEHPLELLMRRLYAFEVACQDVHQVSDWKCPSGDAGKRWKTKVKWGQLDIIDLHALEAESASIPAVNAEAFSVAETQRRHENYAS